MHVNIRDSPHTRQKPQTRHFIKTQRPQRRIPRGRRRHNHAILARCFGHAKRMRFRWKIRFAKGHIATQQNHRAIKLFQTSLQRLAKRAITSWLCTIKDHRAVQPVLLDMIAEPCQNRFRAFAITHSNQGVSALKQVLLCLSRRNLNCFTRKFKRQISLFRQRIRHIRGPADRTLLNDLRLLGRFDQRQINARLKEQRHMSRTLNHLLHCVEQCNCTNALARKQTFNHDMSLCKISI